MAYPSVAYKQQSPGFRPIAETSTVQAHPLGTLASAVDDTYGVAQFLYLSGVASTAAGDVVAYNLKTGATVRAISGGPTSVGPVAVAMSANVAGQFGWYAIFGAVPVTAAGVAASDSPLYLTSTAGQVDDSAVAGDLVSGLISRAATSGGYATCQLDHPSIDGGADASLTATIGGVLTFGSVSAGVETANSIEVEATIIDLLGNPASGVYDVMVRSLAVTDGQGDISLGAGANPGTLVKAYNPAAGENVAWIRTTAAAHFRFVITNTAAEANMVHLSADGTLATVLRLVFA